MTTPTGVFCGNLCLSSLFFYRPEIPLTLDDWLYRSSRLRFQAVPQAKIATLSVMSVTTQFACTEHLSGREAKKYVYDANSVQQFGHSRASAWSTAHPTMKHFLDFSGMHHLARTGSSCHTDDSRPEGNLRCCAYSPCGRYFAWASPEK